MNRRSYNGENNPFFGKHHSQATKLIISTKMKGRKPDLTKRRSYVGILNPNYGKHHSKETKERISQSSIGILKRVYPEKSKLLFDLEKNNEVITGTLLSDATLRDAIKGHSIMSMEQRYDRNEFIFELGKELRRLGLSYSTNNRFRTRPDFTDKQLHSIYLNSNSNWFFTLLRDRWYPNGIKIVPYDILLNAKTIAWWFMGDGCSSNYRNGNVSIIFCTNSFQEYELDLLIKKLNKLGMKGWIKRKNMLFLNRFQEVTKFMKIIEPHILKCFHYKIKYPIRKKDYDIIKENSSTYGSKN